MSDERPIKSPLEAGFQDTKFRLPPQNIEAEISALGALMLDSEAAVKVVDILTSEDFYRPQHRLIFSVILELFEKSQPIDVISVSNRLKEKGVLEQAGGSAYLADLVNASPTASNVAHYGSIVRRKRILRDLIQASVDISELGYREEENVDDLLDKAEKRIFSISQNTLSQKFTILGSALEEAWERIDYLHKNKNELRGVPTGFRDIDKVLAGLQKSDLIIVAARPSFGKTAFVLDIARHVAVEKNMPVGIFSLEMSTVLQMRAMARRLQAEHGKLGLVVVDYLQLMQPKTSSESMVQQITEISRSLKGLARELDVPVIAISQLSRAVEMRHPPVPRLSDLRESGSIEQDADVVMFIYKEDRYKENSSRENQADIIIAKHRNGPLGKTVLYWNPEKVSFSSFEEGSGFESFEIE